MSRWYDIRRHLKAAVAPFLCFCAVIYFGYHTVQGDRGLIAYARLSNEIADAREALAKVHTERAALEHRVSLLRPDSIDRDMLDEQARRVLGYSDPDDVVIYRDR